MAFSSFYGGRQGASFVIVKRFDAVSIAEDTYYRKVLYAINENGYFIYNDGFIEKNANNYTLYDWQWVTLNGSYVTVINSQGVISQQRVSTAYQEGMVECFKKGGESTDIVNYGEYVIIDTMEKSNPDNGKVYRRGMNYDYNPTTNPLAGAEYIGQIVGPQGDIPDIHVNNESVVKSFTGYREDEYNPVNGGIVPGQYVAGYSTATFLGTYTNAATEILNNVSNPQRNTLYSVLNGGTQVYEYYTWTSINGWHQETPTYSDAITYSWVNVRDIENQYYGALIGFTFPYLVESFTATAVSAYYHRDNQGIPFRNMNLIERVDDGSHPYYQNWRIKVPEGIKGDTITALERINTVALKGAKYYSDTALTTQVGTLSAETALNTNSIDYSLSYVPIVISGTTYYVANNNTSTGKTILRYTQTNYNRREQGDSSFVPIGVYNIIKSIELTNDGKLYVDYTYDGLKQVNTNNIIKWISSMAIAQNGTYTVTYNDGTTDTGNIHFISDITIAADGTITYKYSDGTTAKTQTKLIKWIENVTLDDRDGNGTQKISITYNNNSGGSITQEIGQPLNYILEAVVTEARVETPLTPPFHLLVLYSDPVRRAAIVTDHKNATYRSIYPDSNGVYIRNDWYDLGNVRGAEGGLGILTKLANANLLKDDSNSHVPIPPEYMLYAVSQRSSTGSYIYNPPQGLDSQNAGWLVSVDTSTALDPDTVDVYFYDYSSNTWNKLSGIGGGGGQVNSDHVTVVPYDASVSPVDSLSKKLNEIDQRFADGNISFIKDGNNNYYYKKSGDNTLYSLGAKVTTVDPGENSTLAEGSLLIVIE